MRGGRAHEDLGKTLPTRRNIKYRVPETELNLKWVRHGNKAGVVQMKGLRRRVREIMSKE